MDPQQALADLAEVRYRLAGTQRFAGFSGAAAAASGIIGLAAGLLQALMAPRPVDAGGYVVYFGIWYTTLALALVINYGAVAMWLAKNRGVHAKQQSRLAAFAMVPAIVLGGVLTLALVDHGLMVLVPGVWYGAYAVALFASRTLVPTSVLTVAGAFGVIALALLLPFESIALAWWVMPLGFGLGQIVIGVCLARDRAEALL